MKRSAPLLLLVALLLALCGRLARDVPNSQAQSTVTLGTLADITGDGSAHALGTGTARWIIIDCASTNSAAVRLGDLNVGASRGTACAAGGGFFYPPLTVGSNLYDLSKIYYRAASSDVLRVQFAQ